jgi:hypothetical protein
MTAKLSREKAFPGSRIGIEHGHAFTAVVVLCQRAVPPQERE